MATHHKPRDGSDMPVDSAQIPEVKLKSMSGIHAVMLRIRNKVADLLVGLGISSGVGYGVGNYARDQYRETVHYDPEAGIEDTLGNDSSEEGEEEMEDEPSGVLGRAKEALHNAAEWSKQKVERSFLGKKYRELKQELQGIKQGILKTGDKLVFWTAFILTALACAYVLRSILSTYRKIVAPVDPMITENFRELQRGVNRVIRELNALRQGPPPGEAIDATLEHVIERLDEIEKAMAANGLTVSENGERQNDK